MRQINPMWKASANAEKTKMSRETGRARWRKKCAKGREFLDGTHEYERTFSDQGTGELRVMGGREAKALNKELFEQFLVAVSTNVEGRSLERWKARKRFVKASGEVTA